MPMFLFTGLVLTLLSGGFLTAGVRSLRTPVRCCAYFFGAVFSAVLGLVFVFHVLFQTYLL